MREYSHNVMKILVISNVTREIHSSSKSHVAKPFGLKVPTIFKFAQFVILESITYVKPSAKASFMSMSTFVMIVVPCDLCPIIAYANVIGNDAL